MYILSLMQKNGNIKINTPKKQKSLVIKHHIKFIINRILLLKGRNVL